MGFRVIGACVITCLALGCSANDSQKDNGGSGATGAGGTGTGGTGTGGTGGGIGLGGTGSGGSGTGGDNACTQSIDIVFVMDVSTSMGPFLTKLAQEMPAVDSAAKALNLASAPHYGLVVFVDDTLIANSSQPYTDVSILQSDFQSWANFTQSNQQVNVATSNGTFPENSLDALYRASTEFAWRPAASTLRIVIHTTDDTFWNGPTSTDGVQVIHNYTDTVKSLTDNQVRVFAFASLLGGPLEFDDVSQGWFAPYAGAKSIPDSTGGGVFKLDDVLSGSISLSASINAAVGGSLCKPYPTPR
jgi:hypothetical protein